MKNLVNILAYTNFQKTMPSILFVTHSLLHCEQVNIIKTFKNLILHWSLVNLQCPVSFWCTAKWFSYICTCCCCWAAKLCSTLSTPRTVAHQVLLSMGFPMWEMEYFLPHQWTRMSQSSAIPALQGTTEGEDLHHLAAIRMQPGPTVSTEVLRMWKNTEYCPQDS